MALLGSSLGRSSRGRMFLVRAACVIPAPTMPRERTWSRASCMSTGVLSPASSASLLRLLLLFFSRLPLPPSSLLTGKCDFTSLLGVLTCRCSHLHVSSGGLMFWTNPAARTRARGASPAFVGETTRSLHIVLKTMFCSHPPLLATLDTGLVDAGIGCILPPLGFSHHHLAIERRVT